MKRWWIYQRERFPIVAHAPLIAAFSSSAVCYTALLAGDHRFPRGLALAVAFVTCLIFFLQLRIADEFKDHDEDCRFRPYRPVPRGLVKLRELGWLFAFGAGVQGVAAWWFEVRLIWILALAWIYLSLMSVEFFARDWLKARPVTYLWTHMLIMPIVDFYATACYWVPNEVAVPRGLIVFLGVSFFNGLTIELGRKLRIPAAEEEGVPTYSKLWGPEAGAWIWTSSIGITCLLAIIASLQIAFTVPLIILSTVLLSAATFQTLHFCKHLDSGGSARRFEHISAFCTLAMYLMLGLTPMAIRSLSQT